MLSVSMNNYQSPSTRYLKQVKADSLRVNSTGLIMSNWCSCNCKRALPDFKAALTLYDFIIFPKKAH